MSVDQHLDFGEIVILNNNVVSQLSILSNDTVITDPNIVIIRAGKAGQYFFYNLPSSFLINVSIGAGPTISTFSGTPPPTQFNIEPYFDFPSYTSNALGELTLRVPGVLRTSGDTNPYVDGLYYRYYEITLNY